MSFRVCLVIFCVFRVCNSFFLVFFRGILMGFPGVSMVF